MPLKVVLPRPCKPAMRITAGLPLVLNSAFGSAHQLDQLILHDLNHQLAGANGIDHLFAQSFFLYRIGKFFGYFIVHIRIHQRTADFLYSSCNIQFGDPALTLYLLKGRLEPFRLNFQTWLF